MTDDEHAFSDLVRAHLAAVRGYVTRRLPADEVDDAVAEVFASAWRQREHLPDPPTYWLLHAASYQIRNQYRQRGRLARLAERLGQQRPPGPPVPQDASVEELTVYEALAKLPEADREVIRLVAWEDLDTAGIAQVLGCSLVTARSRVHRARKKLKRILDPPRSFAPTLATDPGRVR
jgi:RNA polymerase sigma-70 factor (ECF subfamily)